MKKFVLSLTAVILIQTLGIVPCYGLSGTFVKCLCELVTEKFGKDKWQAALEQTGLPNNTVFKPVPLVDDSAAFKLFDSAGKVLGVTQGQLADAFGDYWMNVYAPKFYPVYFSKSKTAKEFLLNMQSVHQSIAKIAQMNARPPTFLYEQPDAKTLIITYQSTRDMPDFVVGMAKGVGRYFKENLAVTKLSSSKVKIVFAE
jgi:hypothetical protein